MGDAELPVFVPDWDLPAGVRALQTECGRGPSPFGGFNLGDHVGDDPARVSTNRRRLSQSMGAIPIWLRQVHGTRVCHIEDAAPEIAQEADAAMTIARGRACAIMTADCLPVLIADREARVVGAAHAGWRGLAAGVIQRLLADMTQVPGVRACDLIVWLGPAIGPTAFEVGQDVIDAFVAQSVANRRHFKVHPESREKFLVDLPGLALDILVKAGVKSVTDSGLCTMSLPERFYSYRRDGITGRMASLIWLD